MTDESYLYVIIALMPIAASMLVFQANPYHALVIRGLLGAVSALIYAVLGAADVALTEALVGTLLAIMLYAIAVRSSLVLRLGVLDVESPQPSDRLGQLLDDLRRIFDPYHLRLELVPYATPQALERALMDKEIHAACTSQGDRAYQTATRVQRLYDIMQSDLTPSVTNLTYVPAPAEKQK